MKKIKQTIINLISKIKRLTKSPSQFLVSLEKGEYNKAYSFYFYSILNNVVEKTVVKKKNVDTKQKHQKMRERMLELANVQKTKYDQNEHTKRFFDILEKTESHFNKSENFQKKKSLFLNDLTNKFKEDRE